MVGTSNQLELVPQHAFMGPLCLIQLLIFKRERRECSYLLACPLAKLTLQKPEEYGLFHIQGPEL
jgi:hypothetical protein